MRGLVAFFVPLNRAMGVDAREGYFGSLGTDRSWLSTMVWPKSVNTLQAQVGNRDFVALRFTHYQQQTGFDFQPFALAMQEAGHVTGHSDQSVTTLTGAFSISLPVREQEVTGSTVTVITTVDDEDAEGGLSNSLSESFDKGLGEVTMLERAYMSISRDIAYRPITRRTCFPFCPFSICRDDGHGQWSEPSLFGVNYERFGGSSAELLTPVQIAAMKANWRGSRQDDPFLRAYYMMQDARHSLEITGEYSQAIVLAYTAMEMLLDAVWVSMAWEEITYQVNPDRQATFEEVQGWFSGRSTLDTRLTNCFQGRLKGWDTENKAYPAYWFRYGLAKLRHRIVHSGYRVSESQAAEALSLWGDLEEHLKILMTNSDNRYRHPRTSYMWIREAGLKRLGAYTRRMEKIIEAPDDRNWIDDLVAFRRKLDERLKGREEDFGEWLSNGNPSFP